MISKRYLSLFFSSIAVGVLVSNCTVKESDDDETNCTPNKTSVCSCADGAKGTQTCNADGNGFSKCECTAGGTGGSGGQAGGTSAAGSGGTDSTAGQGGTGTGGDAGAAGSGGAGEGGSGGLTDPGDICDACAKAQCAEAWGYCFDTDTACSGIPGSAGAGGDSGTPSEYFCITGCMLGKRETTTEAFITKEDLKTCIEQDPCNLTNQWWDRASSTETRVLINCMAGPGWDTATTGTWSAAKCKDECFSRITK